jgi:hypothetical protein
MGIVRPVRFALLAAAIACLGLAAARWINRPPAPSPGAAPWRVEPASQSFGVVPSGSTVHLTYTVHNDTDQELWVLGCDERCEGDGCLAAPGLPMTVPPFGSRTLVVKTSLRTPCDYRKPLTIFANRESQPQLVLIVEGRVVEPTEGGKPAARSPDH